MNQKSLCASLVLLISLALFLLWPVVATAYGQGSVAGAILGTVMDPSGAVVSGAEVTVTNTATLKTQGVTTNPAGFYDVENLEAGVYNVTIRIAGFKSHLRQDVKVHATERVTVNATLELGEIGTQITVTSSAVTVNTASSDTGGTIVGDHIQQVLLNGRDYKSLALLIPGVNSNRGGDSGAGQLTINGMDSESNKFSVDGAYNSDASTGDPLRPPLDSIAEFRVMTGSYSARYGTTGSGQGLVQTKSGTREFHGSAYEYIRNDALDAKNFFATSKPVHKDNNFGFSFGGPFYIPGVYNTDKRKTFFFVNEEWRKNRTPNVLRGAMIPEPMRRGDFSNSPTLGAGLKLSPSGAELLARLRPGVNCVIDSTHLNPACFDPNAVKIMNKYWPLPNNPAGGFQNYINQGPSISDGRYDGIRVDHNFTEKINLMARFGYQPSDFIPPAFIFGGGNPAPTTGGSIPGQQMNNMIRLTTYLSPTTFNQFTASMMYNKTQLNVTGTFMPKDIDLTVNRPFPNADPRGRMPDISIARGWAGVGSSIFPFTAANVARNLADDFSTVKGSHVLQIGMFWNSIYKRQDVVSFPQGRMSFSGVHTNDPVGDFLLGLNASFSQDSGLRRAMEPFQQFEAYFQDDWKATPRLTLNLGVRYVYYSSETIEGDNFTDFDPKRWDPAKAPQVLPNGRFVLDSSGNALTSTGALANELNGIVFAGKDGVPRGIFVTPKLMFGPRVGFAWDVFGNGKTALRGGFGLGNDRLPFGSYFSMSNPPFIQSVTLLNGTLTDPTGGSLRLLKSARGLSFLGPPGATFHPKRIMSWNLTVQREVTSGGIFTIGYAGSGQRFLPGTTDFNFPLPVSAPSIADPRCLQPGQSIPPGGFDFDPCLNRGLVSSHFTRPFAGWGGMTADNTGATRYYGNSNYHSLQTGFVYRGGRGLTLNSAYTWGKVLTDVAFAAGGFNPLARGGAQNSRNFKAEYGRPGWDRTHIFTIGYVYDLPFFKGRTGFVGQTLGGWGVSGITVVESGFVFTPGLGTGTTGLANRPHCGAGDVNDGPKTLGQWFNTGVFQAPAFGFFGNCGRGTIQGPGEQTWNTAVFKNFRVGDRVAVQFRSEFFNLFNHPNFLGLNTSLGSPDFGKITSAKESRQIQFGLRIEF